MKADAKPAACCVCGCTENNACGMGCWWVRSNPPLCSNPMCQLIDALQYELKWLKEALKLGRRRRRTLSDIRLAKSSIGKLLREIKKNRGDLG